MSLVRAVAAVLALAAFLLAGAVSAQAGNGTGGGSSSSSVRGNPSRSDGHLTDQVYYPFVLY